MTALPALQIPLLSTDGPGHTYGKVEQKSAKQTIINFTPDDNGAPGRDPMKLRSFFMGKGGAFEWSFLMTPGQRDGFLSLHLRLDASAQAEVHASIRLGIVDEKGQLGVQRNKTCRFTEGMTDGFDNLVHNRFLLKNGRSLMPDNELTLACQVTLFYDLVDVGDDIPDGCDLKEDFSNLLEDSIFSDVTLSASDGEVIKAHKCILAARSEVFCAMFDHEMAESKESRVEISDIKSHVLAEMLRHIYTGSTEFEPEMAADLLAAADKYALERLKTKCEEQLCRGLTTENVVESLILADRHNVSQLKDRAIEFINANSIVIDTSDFLEMVKAYPELAVDVIRGRATDDALAPSNKRLKYF